MAYGPLATRPTWVVRTAVTAVLVPVSIRLYHLLLLGQQYESPLPVALLAAAVPILLALLSGVNRATLGRAARRPESWCRLGLVVFFVLGVVVFHQAFDRAASDGRGYFVQTRSLVIDGDLDIAEEIRSFRASNGARFYPVGTALLWVPFYAAAHAYLAILNGFGHDFDLAGYANPYQRAVGLGTLVYGLLALSLIYDLIRRWFSEKMALATVVLLSAGTFVGWYLVRESTMSHGASMFTTTLFLYLWIRTLGQETARRWTGLGALAGLMILVRYQNAAFMVAPLLETLVEQARAIRTRDRQRFLAATGRGSFFLAGLAVALTPLLAMRGSGIPGVLETAAGQGVQWASPALIDVLFSSDHGLLSWTPLLYLGIFGLPLIARRHPMVGSAILLAFSLQLWINGMLPGGGGAGFGARRFTNCALILALGLAASLQWLKAHPRLTLVAVSSLLVGWNLVFMGEMYAGRLPGGGGIPFDAMADAVYRRIGNPFSLPRSLYFGWTHGASPRLYDRVKLRTYSNLQVDFGNDGDDSFLNRGWSSRERGEGGVTFRWAEGRSADLVVPLRDGFSYLLVVRCGPFRFPDAPPQTLEVLVNGVAIGRATMRDSSQEYEFVAPAELIADSIVHVTFRFGYARSPSSLGLSADRRALSVRFVHLRMRILE